MKKIKIGKQYISNNSKTYFIADIAEARSIQRVIADPRVQNNGPGQEMV